MFHETTTLHKLDCFGTQAPTSTYNQGPSLWQATPWSWRSMSTPTVAQPGAHDGKTHTHDVSVGRAYTAHTAHIHENAESQTTTRSTLFRARPPLAAKILTDFAPIDKALPARLRLPASEDTGPLACSFHGAEAPRGKLTPAPLPAVAGPTTETKEAAGRQIKSKAPRSAMLRPSMVLLEERCG